MKIGLIDIDSKIPNLALMKLSTFHKNKGDDVEWWKGNLFHSQYDKVYASKVFDFSKMLSSTKRRSAHRTQRHCTKERRALERVAGSAGDNTG